MSDLSKKHCVPCEGGVQPLSRVDAEKYKESLSSDWELTDNDKAITRTLKRTDFKDALALVNAIGEIAEEEGHHPDLCIRDYNTVSITLSTHAIGGLSENDFILAAKIDTTAE